MKFDDNLKRVNKEMRKRNAKQPLIFKTIIAIIVLMFTLFVLVLAFLPSSIKHSSHKGQGQVPAKIKPIDPAKSSSSSSSESGATSSSSQDQDTGSGSSNSSDSVSTASNGDATAANAEKPALQKGSGSIQQYNDTVDPTAGDDVRGQTDENSPYATLHDLERSKTYYTYTLVKGTQPFGTILSKNGNNYVVSDGTQQ